jgi:PAS domain S-box-containing protein
MSDQETETPRSVTGEHLAAVEELVRLEEENAAQGLGEEARARWQELTRRIFGASSQYERRKFVRIHARHPAELLATGGPVPAEVTSVSAGGLFLRTDQASSDMVGNEFDVVVRFPQVQERATCFKVRVCWAAPVGKSSEPGVGVQFVDLSREQRRLLLDHLRGHLLRLLELSREKYHFFFRHSADGALLLSPEGTILEASETTEAFLGLSAAQLVGRALESILAPADVATFRRGFSETREQSPVRLNLSFVDSEGRNLPAEVLIAPFHIHDLQIGAMLVVHDLRAQRRVEDRQRALERQVLQADKLTTIGQIAASIAHDINNPLSYVLTNITLLEEYLPALQTLVRRALDAGDETGVSREILATLDADLGPLLLESLHGIGRIRDIMGDLREFTRLESDVVARVDVNHALDTALRLVRNLIHHRATLEQSLAPNLPPTHLNFARLSQVFVNLLTNAAHAFVEPDLQRNKIWVSTRLAGDRILASIRDNGPGVPEEIRDVIFEPFFTTRRPAGAGLGLAIAREAVEDLGGTLTMDSPAGEGTCFTVSLPVVRPGGEVAAGPAETSGARRRRLLLIDDDPIVLRSLERTLEQVYQVRSTVSPLEALELLETEPFDVILSDVMIPEMRGAAFRDQVSRRFPVLVTKIVFMTGGAFDLSEAERQALSTHRVLSKPIGMKELLQELASV